MGFGYAKKTDFYPPYRIDQYGRTKLISGIFIILLQTELLKS